MKKKNENDFLGFFECGRVCRTTVVVLLVVASDVRPPVVAFPAKELIFIIMHSPANKNISQVCCIMSLTPLIKMKFTPNITHHHTRSIDCVQRIHRMPHVTRELPKMACPPRRSLVMTTQ
jgi:hypothetical protein